VKSLRDKKVLVTGASSGIGAALARRLGQEGAVVLLLARTEEKLGAVAADVKAAGGSAHVFPVDLYDKEATAAVVARIREQLGVVDVVVNNAGAGHWVEIDAQSVDDAEEAMTLPLLAAFRVTLPFLPAMVGQASGLVVTVTSSASLTAVPGTGAYNIARKGMQAFHEQLHEDLRNTGVRSLIVNAAEVTSDYFKTHADSHERIPKLAQRVLGKATPEEAADAMVAAMKSGRRELYLPWRFALLRPLFQHTPWFITFLARTSGWRRKTLPPGS
jgi:short-subunit dehydrogenase